MYCQVCGKRDKSDTIKKRWDGLWVCASDWEERHPLDYLKTPTFPREGSVPYQSPEPEYLDQSPTYWVDGYTDDDGIFYVKP